MRKLEIQTSSPPAPTALGADLNAGLQTSAKLPAVPVVLGADLKAWGITDPENQYLPRKDAAKFIGQQVQTLASWACNKRHNLPYRKCGRQALYKVSDLLTFLDRGN